MRLIVAEPTKKKSCIIDVAFNGFPVSNYFLKEQTEDYTSFFMTCFGYIHWQYTFPFCTFLLPNELNYLQEEFYAEFYANIPLLCIVERERTYTQTRMT